MCSIAKEVSKEAMFPKNELRSSFVGMETMKYWRGREGVCYNS
jgi:hypothetical protein